MTKMGLLQLFASGRKKIKDEPVTMEEHIKKVNEERMSIGYPHMLRFVTEKCPDCGCKMTHDDFQKAINPKGGLLACYECIGCGERIMFDMIKKKFTDIRMNNDGNCTKDDEVKG